MIKAQIIRKVLQIPIISGLIREFANKFEEGSIVTIKSGYAKGMLWKRYHRYVNGYWAGIYELPVQKRMTLELKEGMVFFDIGANAGFFSLVAAKIVGERGKVISFEPLPMNINVIKEQFEINGLTQCICIESAIGSHCRKSKLFLPVNEKSDGKYSEACLVNGDISELEGYEYEVDVITLDYFTHKYNIFPDLIKIDVEGAESDVLNGATSLLQSDKAPRIIMELHEVTSNDIQNQLKSYGYRFLPFKESQLIIFRTLNTFWLILLPYIKNL